MAHGIFSTYSQGENRITASIMQVLKHLPINVVEHFLTMFSESDSQDFIRFKNQVRSKKSIPDAEISANFRLLFETKLYPNSIGGNEPGSQLNNHLLLTQEDEFTILVYLTPDQQKPEVLIGEKVVWKSFQDLHNLISELMTEPTLILSERDQFLLKNLQDLFSESRLLPKTNEVVIVAASDAWPAYQKHGVYVCQADRSFRDVDLLGFYAEGKIQKKIAKINERIESFEFCDGALAGDTELNAKLRRWLKDNAWVEERSQLQVFDLSGIEDPETITLPNTIVNDLKNDGGRGYAFTQGQRYVLLCELHAAKKTSDL